MTFFSGSNKGWDMVVKLVDNLGFKINPSTSDNQTNGNQKTQIVSNELISTGNSSSTPLLANITFTGAWEDVSSYASIALSAYSDVPGTLYADLSPDGVTITTTLQLSDGTNGQMGYHGLIPTRQYYRVRVVNGVSNQTTCLIQSIYHKNPKIAMVTSRINQVINDYTDVLNTRSVITGKDIETGNYINVLVNSDGCLGSISYENLIAQNSLTDDNIVRVLGRANSVDNIRTDLWIGPTVTYVFPPAGGIQMRLVSSSANDTLAGTGAQKMMIHYLDASYIEHSEIISMNGTTPVTTVATNILRINSFHIYQSGTGGTSAGNISLTNTAGTITYAYLDLNYNESRMAVYTIPAGKTLYLNHWQGSSGTTTGNHFTRIALRATSHSGILLNTFNAIDEVGTMNGGDNITFPIPIAIPATADVKITAISDSSSADAIVMGAFHGWIENN
jgi:hypothetical protein